MSIGAQAQRPGTTQWTASRVDTAPYREGAPVRIALNARVEEGWHVYAMTQAPGGPTALSVKGEPDAPLELVGAIDGTKPLKHHDASFDLDTEFYTGSFRLELVARPKAAASSVPLAVRYQMCSDTTCMPPKTVHLVAELISAK
jgi:hypothetical protein